MSEVGGIVKNSSFLFISQFFISASTLIISILIARLYGEDIFGAYSFAIAFTAVFAIFSDMGYTQLVIKELACQKQENGSFLSNAIGFRVIFTIIVMLIVIITINLLNYPQQTKYIVYLFGLYTLINTFSTIFRGVYRAYQKMGYEALIAIIGTLFKLTLVAVILIFQWDIYYLAIGFIISAIFDLILHIVMCNREFIKLKINFDTKFLKNTILSASTLNFLTVFSALYTKFDTIMLSFVDGNAVVGWYNASYNLVLGFKPFAQILMSALFPILVNFSNKDSDLIKTFYKVSFRYLLMIGLPLSVGIMLTAKTIILLFYGAQYEPSIIALQILSWDIILFFLITCLSFTIIAINKQNELVYSLFFCLILNIVLNLIIIPKFSYIGAGITTIISEIVLLSLYFHIASKYITKLSIIKLFFKPVLGCIVMAIIFIILEFVGLYISIIVSMISYFTFLLITKEFTNDDFTLVRTLFIRFKKT